MAPRGGPGTKARGCGYTAPSAPCGVVISDGGYTRGPHDVRCSKAATFGAWKRFVSCALVVDVSECRGALRRPGCGGMAVTRDDDPDGMQYDGGGWIGPDQGAMERFTAPLAGAGAGGLDGDCTMLRTRLMGVAALAVADSEDAMG
jgi:hypothetical protein